MLTAALKLRKGDDIHAIQALIRRFLARLDKLPGLALNSGVYLGLSFLFFVFGS